MEALDLGMQTLFADFQESVLLRFRLEREKSLKTIFVRKTVKNQNYWYTQEQRSTRRKQQQYFGPVNAETNRQAEANRDALRKTSTEIRQLLLRERKKIALLKRAGLPLIDRRTAKLIDHFSKFGLSYQQGVLVGSLAFFAYPGILGTLFEHGHLKTDIDMARSQGDAVSVTTSEDLFADFSDDLRAVPGLRHLSKPSSFLYQSEIRIDFLIPKVGKEKKSYSFPGVVGLGAEALRFLDFLIEERVDGLLLSENKAVPITIPHPVRFALHKVLVGMRRGEHERTKRNKDFHQASQLIPVCAREMPDFLHSSLRVLFSRGKKWKALFQKGCKSLSTEAQQLLLS